MRLDAAAVVAREAEAGTPPKPDTPPTTEEVARLVAVLRRQGFTGNRVVLAAPTSRVFSAVLEMPPRTSGAPVDDLAKQELARAARRDAAKIEVASWDVPSPARTADGLHVLAIGLSHEDSSQILDAFESAGLVVQAIDSRCWAMARASRSVLGNAEQVSAVLDVSDSAASLTVVNSGVVAYDRPMAETGLARLREAACAELKIEADAADYLIETLSSGGSDDTLSEHTIRTGRKLLDDYTAMIVQELRSVMAYAMHRYPGPVGPVLLTGEGADNKGLHRRIREELDLEARVVTPGDACAASGPSAGEAALTVAVGLAMHAVSAPARRAA